MNRVRVPREYRALGVTPDEWAYEEVAEAIDDAVEPFPLWFTDALPQYLPGAVRQQVLDDFVEAGLLVRLDFRDGAHYCPATIADQFPEPRMYVYRLYDAADVLLYVGCTSRVVRDRVADHSRKPWGASIARVAVEEVTGWSRGWATETAAILRERPLHNKSKNTIALRMEALSVIDGRAS